MLRVFVITVSALGLLMQPAHAARRCVMPDGSAIYIIGACPGEKKPPVPLPESAAELASRKAEAASLGSQNAAEARSNPPADGQASTQP